MGTINAGDQTILDFDLKNSVTLPSLHGAWDILNSPPLVVPQEVLVMSLLQFKFMCLPRLIKAKIVIWALFQQAT